MVLGCAGTGGTGDEKPAPVPTGPPINKKAAVAELSDDERAFPELPKAAGAIDEDAPKNFTRTASGLGYRILRKADGRKPKATETVVAHYKGWLDDGTQFDSSYDRGGKPISFSLSGVIPGWTEGLQHVGVGGMIELDIPSELGYGQRGQGSIPPGARLHFLVELKEIK
jgi:FKBP-type peptidyl-prolyl cis-trans isomerase